MSPYLDWDTVRLLLPELLLVVAATLVFVAGAFLSRRGACYLFLMLSLAACGGLMAWQDNHLGVFTQSGVSLAEGPLTVDALGHMVRWLVLVVGALMLLSMWQAATDALSTDYLGSLFLVLAGMMIVARASELVLLFLGLELISIPTYIMLFIGRKEAPSREATTKYFFLSILSSGLLLYGFAFLYGATGTLQLDEMAAVFAGHAADTAAMTQFAAVALVLIFAGLAFKLAAVPFHFYAPDVYQGTTAANAGLLSVAPKIAGLIVLLRIVLSGLVDPNVQTLGWQIAIAISLVTMTLGNILALLQNNVRRMMAYSSVAHAGYLLIGVAVATAVSSGEMSTARVDGTSAALFYLVVYALATLGVFAVLAYLAGPQGELDDVAELAGLSKTKPLAAVAMTVCLFSLTGVPPLAGFWGKLSLFAGGLWFDRTLAEPSTRHAFLALVIVGAINAAISAGYYLRLVGVMYFRPAEGKLRQPNGSAGPLAAAVAAAVLVLAIGLAPGFVFEQTNRAATPLRQTVAAREVREPSQERTEKDADRTLFPALSSPRWSPPSPPQVLSAARP